MAPKVLVVLTSHADLGNTGKKIGWYLTEFAHPYYKLEGHADITVVSPKGGEAPLDPTSVEMFKDDAEGSKFLKEKEGLWKKTEKLEDYLGRVDEFDVVFYPGGHGPMFDLATDPASHQLIRTFHSQNKIIAAVCHGPAALVNVKLDDGSWLVDGKEISAFTNEEEDQAEMTDAMPFLLETALKEHGVKVVKTEPWGAKTVVDGKLITGQNPASAAGVGEAIVKALVG